LGQRKDKMMAKVKAKHWEQLMEKKSASKLEQKMDFQKV